MLGSQQQCFDPIRDDIRFEVFVNTFRVTSYVVYEINICDMGLKRRHRLYLRFSQLKDFHKKFIKSHNEFKSVIPQFPKTNSFGFWNKTNKDHRKIQDRRRQLQFYLTKLLNDQVLRGWAQIKKLFKFFGNDRRLTKSFDFEKSDLKLSKSNSLDQNILQNNRYIVSSKFLI